MLDALETTLLRFEEVLATRDEKRTAPSNSHKVPTDILC